jgi:ABC-type sugar transport system ATPase subunit
MPEIYIENLRKEYKEVVAVRDVTITFEDASVTCLLGPSGCGKTTLLRMIAGLEEPTAGDVYFDNERVTDLEPGRRNIGMVFQYPVVYRGLDVYRNIELPLLEEKLPENERRERIEEVIEMMNLEGSIHKDITQLDNSERQKVAVARVIARKPRIILFDEPLTNVDVRTRSQLEEGIKRLTREVRQTIIYVTHNQTEAMTLADKIALMNNGVIIQYGEPRTLYNRPDDLFGGWFFGNPGMNFIESDVKRVDDYYILKCPLFPLEVNLSGLSEECRITIGIRPEHIRIVENSSPTTVSGKVVRKSIVIGEQYLLVIEVGEILFKAKVRPEIGRMINGDVIFEIPLENLVVFGPDGRRLDVKLEVLKRESSH